MGKGKIPSFMVQSPYFVNGYYGYFPNHSDMVGVSFAKGTHELLSEPPWDSKQPVLSPVAAEELPPDAVQNARRFLDEQSRRPDGDPPIYGNGMTSGYFGYVPRINYYSGMSFPKSSTLAVAEFEQHQRKERNLRREMDIATRVQDSTIPIYDVPPCLQIPPMTLRYGAPLELVQPYPDKYVPKDRKRHGTSIYDMHREDPDKYVVAGYMGNVPLYKELCGHTHKDLTKQAVSGWMSGRPYFKAPSTEKEDHCVYYDGNEMPELVCPKPRSPTIYQRAKWAEAEKSKKAKCREPLLFPVPVGLTPTYAGHVPGMREMVGMTFGKGVATLAGMNCVNPLHQAAPLSSKELIRQRCINDRLAVPYLQ